MMLEKVARFCKWLLVIPILLGFSPPEKETATLRLIIRPMFNEQPLVLKKQVYETLQHDSIYIDAFKFYLSEPSIVYQARYKVNPAINGHLVNAADTASLCINLGELSPGEVSRISFYVGVDSLTNVSGALGGDLDPSKAMYWAWNTGYINAKLEGRSSLCKTLHHAFEFHIGGYLPPYNTRRRISLDLRPQVLEAGQVNTIVIVADVSEWIGRTDLRKVNSVVMPSWEAMAQADYYANMFSTIRP